MSTEPKTPNKFSDTPRDKPVSEHTEHANLERPGAQAHPRASWNFRARRNTGWRIS